MVPIFIAGEEEVAELRQQVSFISERGVIESDNAKRAEP